MRVSRSGDACALSTVMINRRSCSTSPSGPRSVISFCCRSKTSSTCRPELEKKAHWERGPPAFSVAFSRSPSKSPSTAAILSTGKLTNRRACTAG